MSLDASAQSLLRRLSKAQIGPSADADLIVWFILQITANLVGMPILVATFLFSRTVKRHPALTNFLITWIISGLSCCLLLYVGEEQGPEPNKVLCIAQASLLESVPPMIATAVLILIYHVWFGMSNRDTSHSTLETFVTLSAPYFVLVVWTTMGATIGAFSTELVNRDRRFFYCSVDFNPYSNSQAIYTAVLLVLSAIFEVHIAIILTRNWRGLRIAFIDLQLVFRVLCFGLYLMAAAIFSISSVKDPNSVLPDMFAASVGMAVLIIFGTQRDIFRAWCFWLPPASASQTQSNRSSDLGLAEKAQTDPECVLENSQNDFGQKEASGV